MNIGPEKTFHQIKDMFENGVEHGYSVKTEKAYGEDKGLATNQARRFHLEATGEEASIEIAYEAQKELLLSFEQAQLKSQEDNLFATVYSSALSIGLTDAEALQQAEEYVANTRHQLKT